MQVNNIPRNKNIQSDNSHTENHQQPGSPGDSSAKKPALHTKERKQNSPEEVAGAEYTKALSPDAQKQATNRFNRINHHLDRAEGENSSRNEKPSELEIAAKRAIESDQNQKFQQYLGIRSPEADKAMAQLKTEKKNSSFYDLDEIEENIIKKNQLQDISPCDTPRPLGKVQTQELSDAVFGKKCFPQFANTPEGTQFVEELTEVVNQKMSQMKPTDKGMALVFRFPGTYGMVGHVALGSLWRDSQGQLQLDISHQESLGPQPELKRLAYTGQIFDSFDTHESYPARSHP